MAKGGALLPVDPVTGGIAWGRVLIYVVGVLAVLYLIGYFFGGKKFTPVKEKMCGSCPMSAKKEWRPFATWGP